MFFEVCCYDITPTETCLYCHSAHHWQSHSSKGVNEVKMYLCKVSYYPYSNIQLIFLLFNKVQHCRKIQQHSFEILLFSICDCTIYLSLFFIQRILYMKGCLCNQQEISIFFLWKIRKHTYMEIMENLYQVVRDMGYT